MLTRLYAWLIALAATRLAPLWLFCTAFAEASFFPIPPDALLIPMILAKPRRAWWLAFVCTAGSVVGGLFGYWIGATLLTRIALPVIHFYHADRSYEAFLAFFRDWGFWAIIAKGLTPIPFKLVTIAAGAAHFDIPKFIIACVITRGGRFFIIEAVPLRIFGDRARGFIEERLVLVTSAVAAAAIGGFLVLRFL
jgi:membrane protein YqaA with SNARE-associated domain